jgi:hypothetical protein
VARALAAYLEAAGAEVLSVRDGDQSLPDAERVRRAEVFRAERYLRIGHREAPPVIGHWFGSAAGNAWARRTQEALASLGCPAPPVAEEPMVALQQASSPALYVSIARVDSSADEERLLAPGALRAEAYAIYLGLVREFAGDLAPAIDSLEVRTDEGRPLPGALVALGGALTLQADASGRVRFARTEPGALEAALVGAGAPARRVLLDSDRGAVLTGRSGR